MRLARLTRSTLPVSSPGERAERCSARNRRRGLLSRGLLSRGLLSRGLPSRGLPSRVKLAIPAARQTLSARAGDRGLADGRAEQVVGATRSRRSKAVHSHRLDTGWQGHRASSLLPAG